MEHKINKIVIAVLALSMLVLSVSSSAVRTSDVNGVGGTNNPDPVNDGSVNGSVTLSPGSTETEAIEVNPVTADIVIPATTADKVSEDAGGIFNIMAVSSSQVSIPDANNTDPRGNNADR